MKALIATIALVGLILGGCSFSSFPQKVSVLTAAVYNIEEPSADDSVARQLGVNVDACAGDYMPGVEEAADSVTLYLENHKASDGDCTDFFWIYLDESPHGKTIIDGWTGNILEVALVPLSQIEPF